MNSFTRYHRMKGHNTVWVPGTDHAGIATQIVVERQLQEQGIASRHDMGATPPEARKNFVSKVWEWKNQSGNTITGQMRRMGDSVDWSREYFTMDDKLSSIVNETFVRLYQQGLIYRGKRLVNWDPKLMSAVSDLEVGDGGHQLGVPVHQALATVDQALLVQAHEGLVDDGRQLVVHGEVLAAPVHAVAHAAHLAGDGVAALVLPLPDLAHEVLARLGRRRAHVVAAGDALLLQLALHHDLGGDARVVGAGHPDRVVALHAVVAREAVHDGLVERM